MEYFWLLSTRLKCVNNRHNCMYYVYLCECVYTQVHICSLQLTHVASTSFPFDIAGIYACCVYVILYSFPNSNFVAHFIFFVCLWYKGNNGATRYTYPGYCNVTLWLQYFFRCSHFIMSVIGIDCFSFSHTLVPLAWFSVSFLYDYDYMSMFYCWCW